MLSDKERIRRAVNKTLKKEAETDKIETPIFDETQRNSSLEMIESGQLPKRIVVKVPRYVNFLQEFARVYTTSDKNALINLVLDNKELVYDDIDFTLYMTFIIKRYETLGNDLQAKAMAESLGIIRQIGLIYG